MRKLDEYEKESSTQIIEPKKDNFFLRSKSKQTETQGTDNFLKIILIADAILLISLLITVSRVDNAQNDLMKSLYNQQYQFSDLQSEFKLFIIDQKSLKEEMVRTDVKIKHLISDITQIQSIRDSQIKLNTQFDYIEKDYKIIIHKQDEIQNKHELLIKLVENTHQIELLDTQMIRTIGETLLTHQESNESDLTQIKSQIADLKSQINEVKGIVTSIQSYGPYIADSWQETIRLTNTDFSSFKTTEQCTITVKGKSLITLIATGLGICQGCQGQITFLKNQKSFLSNAGFKNYLNGSSFLYGEVWLPINLTQVFEVDQGTHTFVLGFNLADGENSYTVEVKSLSFVATVIEYY